MAEHWPGSLPTVMFAGAGAVGFCVSLTVTVNEQLFEPRVQVTVVVLTGKNDPEAWETVTGQAESTGGGG